MDRQGNRLRPLSGRSIHPQNQGVLFTVSTRGQCDLNTGLGLSGPGTAGVYGVSLII